MTDTINIEALKEAFKKRFPVSEITEGKNWCNARYSPHYQPQVHYELIQRGDLCFIEFHVEMKNYDLETKLNNALSLRDYSRFAYYSNRYWQVRTPILSVKNLENDIDKIRNDIERFCLPSDTSGVCVANDSTTMPVGICEVTLSSFLQEKLSIPAYQRGYCWRVRNVLDLLDDIAKWQQQKPGEKYHLGSVILKKKDNGFDIIDGQQRLTTLTIWQKIKESKETPLLSKEFGGSNLTNSSKQALLRARDAIQNCSDELDFTSIVVSAVVIDENQPEDLAYTFFSNSNSTGKRLSDYDLLKTHHLRYIPSTGNMPRKMVDRWHALEASQKQDELLQQMLFRLRNWRSGTQFRLNASNTPERELFRHYAVNVEPLDGLSIRPSRQFRFDSILAGGREFFDYVEHYHERYETFCKIAIVQKLYKELQWHSNGVVHAGIRAIAFLFYCKYGDLYLNDAVYALAYHLSRLRNEYQVRGSYLAGELFQKCTADLDRSTAEGEFISILMDSKQRYDVSNRGKTANLYWESLFKLLESCETENLLAMSTAHYRSSNFKETK